MDNQSVDESDDRAADDAKYLKALSTRNDIFSIEGNNSLRVIGLLALFFGLCFGIWLRFATSLLVRAAHSNSQNESIARSTWQLEEDVDSEEKFPYREITANFILKVKNPSSPKNPPKHTQALSAHKRAFNRTLSKLIIESRVGGAKNDTILARQLMKADITRDTAIVSEKQVQVLERDRFLVQRGDQLKKQSDYIGAFAIYRRVLAQSPQNEKALAGMGDLFCDSGLYDSAVRFYRTALAVNPRNSVVHNGLGTALYENSKSVLRPGYAKSRQIQDPARYMDEQYDSAIAEYTEAISLDSSNVEALTNRGMLHNLNNEPEAAIKDYSLAIKTNPSYADAYHKRAEAYEDLGKFKAAIEDYSAALKCDSTTYEFDPTIHVANAYLGRGRAYYKIGELDNAIADFDSTLALSPKHSLALISKGFALAGKQLYDSAISSYKKAITVLTPAEYDGVMMLAFLQMGNSWKALGKYDSAIADYREAIRAPNLASKACWRIADCYCFKKDTTDALDWLKKARSFEFAETNKWGRDRELSMLRDMPEFKELTREYVK